MENNNFEQKSAGAKVEYLFLYIDGDSTIKSFNSDQEAQEYIKNHSILVFSQGIIKARKIKTP